MKERDLLAAEIRKNGFETTRQTYIRSYGSHELDAALLILPVLDFEDDRSRVTGTIRAIRDELEVDGGIIHRYRPGSDGLEGREGGFLPCSFWLAQALARSGQADEANALFQRLLQLANDVGLFAEEIDPVSSAQLGNFPQAFTHAALIQAALALENMQEIQ